jgi:hypothetical protein
MIWKFNYDTGADDDEFCDRRWLILPDADLNRTNEDGKSIPPAIAYAALGDGRRWAESWPGVNYTAYADDPPPEDFAFGTSYPVVSERVHAMLNKLDPGYAEFLPVTIKCCSGKVLKHYGAINILRRFDTIDPSLSSTSPRGSYLPPWYTKIVLRSHVNHGLHHLWVASEDTSRLFCTDYLKREMEKAKITGIEFEKA